MTRQSMVIGPLFPVYVNETTSKEVMATGPIYINETSGGTSSSSNLPFSLFELQRRAPQSGFIFSFDFIASPSTQATPFFAPFFEQPRLLSGFASFAFSPPSFLQAASFFTPLFEQPRPLSGFTFTPEKFTSTPPPTTRLHYRGVVPGMGLMGAFSHY